jgi:hypothetical protein
MPCAEMATIRAEAARLKIELEQAQSLAQSKVAARATDDIGVLSSSPLKTPNQPQAQLEVTDGVSNVQPFCTFRFCVGCSRRNCVRFPTRVTTPPLFRVGLFRVGAFFSSLTQFFSPSKAVFLPLRNFFSPSKADEADKINQLYVQSRATLGTLSTELDAAKLHLKVTHTVQVARVIKAEETRAALYMCPCVCECAALV